ncbi:MAG: ATP-binding protein [bacterium]
MDIGQIKKIPLFRREIIESIHRWMEDDRLILLVGSRQVGKTSVLYLLIQDLLAKGIEEKSIFYFDLEDFEILELLNSGVKNFIQYLQGLGANLERKVFVFIDEIQYLNNPTNLLKLLSDHHKNIKILCSGSSTLDIRRKFKDSLVGRKIVFEIHTLSFSEFLTFKKKEHLVRLLKDFSWQKIKKGEFKKDGILEIWHRELMDEFEEYMIYGGYPAATLTKEKDKKLTIIQELYHTYVRKDLNQLFTIEDISAFNSLVKLLGLQIGNLVNLAQVSASLSVSRKTIEKYLFILENTFIIKRIMPIFTNKRKEIIKMPKVFFYDVGLRNQVIRNASPLALRADAGALMENYLFSYLINNLGIEEELKFWRTKSGNEVDFVVESGETLLPIEVKYRAGKKDTIPSGIRFFLQKYNPKKALIITRDYLGKRINNGVEIYFIPVYLLG